MQTIEKAIPAIARMVHTLSRAKWMCTCSAVAGTPPGSSIQDKVQDEVLDR